MPMAARRKIVIASALPPRDMLGRMEREMLRGMPREERTRLLMQRHAALDPRNRGTAKENKK